MLNINLGLISLKSNNFNIFSLLIIDKLLLHPFTIKYAIKSLYF